MTGDKAEAYGDPVEFFNRLALRWGHSPERCAEMMEEFKEERLRHRFTVNDDIDRRGYRIIRMLIKWSRRMKIRRRSVLGAAA